MGTYRWKVRFCKSKECCVRRVLEGQIKLSMGEEGPKERRGKPFECLFGKGVSQRILFGLLRQAAKATGGAVIAFVYGSG